MPELPEVETIRRELQSVLPKSRLMKVEVRLPKMVKVGVKTFQQRIKGGSVISVDRRAKLVLVHLSTGWTMIIHLKMTGQLIWRSKSGKFKVGGHPIPGGMDNLPNKYSHVILTTDKGVLFFNDQRQFGFVKLIKSDALQAWLTEQRYGPEPLSTDFRFEDFNVLMTKHAKKKIKPTLMDQSVIAGVGNIYADEALHRARLDPRRKISTIRPLERKALYHALRDVMNLSLRYKGTTADAYRTAHGKKGEMLKFLRVYGRDGLPCKRGDGTIEKITLAGRGTHFCPNCQR